jgi:hypothetical protein
MLVEVGIDERNAETKSKQINKKKPMGGKALIRQKPSQNARHQGSNVEGSYQEQGLRYLL